MQVSNHSLLNYFCIVWSNCSQTNSDELFKLQKRCARLILDSPRDARSYDNFQKLKVARYSFSGSIPPKFEHKLRRHKQSFGKTANTVVLDKDENLL